jgi:hypothetical protein
MSGSKRVGAGKFAEAFDLAEVTQTPENAMSIYLRFFLSNGTIRDTGSKHAG